MFVFDVMECIICVKDAKYKEDYYLCDRCTKKWIFRCTRCKNLFYNSGKLCNSCLNFDFQVENLEINKKYIHECNNGYMNNLQLSRYTFNKIYKSLLNKDKLTTNYLNVFNKYLQKMNVYVKTITGKIIHFTLDKFYKNIFLLKFLVHESENVSIHQIRLIHNGKLLEDDKILDDYDVTQNDYADGILIYCILKLSGD